MRFIVIFVTAVCVLFLIKMNQILRCDWLPRSGQDDGAILPARDSAPCPARKPYCKLVRSRWLDIGLVVAVFFFFLRVYGPRLHLDTPKKNLANIQPS